MAKEGAPAASAMAAATSSSRPSCARSRAVMRSRRPAGMGTALGPPAPPLPLPPLLLPGISRRGPTPDDSRPPPGGFGL